MCVTIIYKQIFKIKNQYKKYANARKYCTPKKDNSVRFSESK